MANSSGRLNQARGGAGGQAQAPSSAVPNQSGNTLAAIHTTVATCYQPELTRECPDIPTVDADLAGTASAYQTYRAWGWPVAMHRSQVRLDSRSDMVGLIVPTLLATEVTTALSARRSSPPVVIHPAAPTHRMLVCSEPFTVELPWPPGIIRVDPPLLLPPTPTLQGSLTWGAPPQPDELRHCREIDAFAALRTLLRDLLLPPR